MGWFRIARRRGRCGGERDRLLATLGNLRQANGLPTASDHTVSGRSPALACFRRYITGHDRAWSCTLGGQTQTLRRVLSAADRQRGHADGDGHHAYEKRPCRSDHVMCFGASSMLRPFGAPCSLDCEKRKANER